MKSYLILPMFIISLRRNDAFCPRQLTHSTVTGSKGPLVSNVWLPYSTLYVNQSARPTSTYLRAQDNGVVAGYESDHQMSTLKTALSIINAALLVSGTTIGGGFLALPAVVSPSGFLPSAVTLIGVWVFFLAQSFILVECITRAKYENGGQPDQSIAATAKSIFGTKGEVFFGALLAILIQATLVSQISRAGMMFPNYRLGCLVSAISISGVVFGPKSGIVFASKANALLTSLFLLSCAAVFGRGIQIADWSRLGGLNDWTSVLPAIPTFLQLLVYGEIVPSVCQILNYNTKHIHKAIIMGSFMTLCLQIGWSGLGLSLVSSSARDPVNVLLSSSGPVQIPLFCLAFTAILTTILGSYLALMSTANDLIQRTRGKKKSKSYSSSLLQRMKVASIITIPASLIACTSPTIFLQAIDFAGSYPVLMLWGVIPPVITLVQRFRSRQESGDFDEYRDLRTAGPSAWIALLGSVSLAMVGMNAAEDVMSIFKML